ncbi:MAG: D-glycerate dehydrogenase [Gemmatimonadales bacterium]|nr:D-glycerate dehydrogenase [Gemmatimonadales bacterium]
MTVPQKIASARPAVVVTRRLPAPVEAAVAASFDARLNPDDTPLTAAELRGALATADAILCTVTDRFDAALIGDEALRCRLLANFGVGYNHIDVGCARAAGIAVSNTPDVLTEATADLTIALMLAVARRMGEGERLVRSGQWHGWAPTALLGRMVSGATLGIVGYGRIGRAVATRARLGFGMRVLCHTRRRTSTGDGVEWRASVDDMLSECDFVSLHCPATPETHHLMNGRRLALMRPSAYLINTARGDVIDEAALGRALRTGVIAGAGLDVYEREPAIAADLVALENVVLLPHLGSATEATRIAMGLRAVANLRAFFDDGSVPDRVG